MWSKLRKGHVTEAGLLLSDGDRCCGCNRYIPEDELCVAGLTGRSDDGDSVDQELCLDCLASVVEEAKQVLKGRKLSPTMTREQLHAMLDKRGWVYVPRKRDVDGCVRYRRKNKWITMQPMFLLSEAWPASRVDFVHGTREEIESFLVALEAS